MLSHLISILEDLIPGIAGALIVFVLTPFLKQFWVTRQLRLSLGMRDGAGYMLEVYNASPFRLAAMSGYITIPNSKDDLFFSPEMNMRFLTDELKLPFKSKEGTTDVRSERTCWAEVGNPAQSSANPGDILRLCVCNVNESERYLEVPSESGYSTQQGRSRTFLRLDVNYDFILTVTSDSSRAVHIHLRWNCKARKLVELNKNFNPRKAWLKLHDPNWEALQVLSVEDLRRLTEHLESLESTARRYVTVVGQESSHSRDVSINALEHILCNTTIFNQVIEEMRKLVRVSRKHLIQTRTNLEDLMKAEVFLSNQEMLRQKWQEAHNQRQFTSASNDADFTETNDQINKAWNDTEGIAALARIAKQLATINTYKQAQSLPSKLPRPF